MFRRGDRVRILAGAYKDYVGRVMETKIALGYITVELEVRGSDPAEARLVDVHPLHLVQER